MLNPLLTAEEVSSSRWCIYLSRRWRGFLGLSPKFCMTWRILKRPHCALTTAWQKIWRVENQKNSDCKCPNHEGNICLEWITKDVVNPPVLGVKKKRYPGIPTRYKAWFRDQRMKCCGARYARGQTRWSLWLALAFGNMSHCCSKDLGELPWDKKQNH